MLKAVNALNSLLGTLLSLVIVGILGGGGWFAYSTYTADQREQDRTETELADRTAQVEGLTKDLANKQTEVSRLSGQLTESVEKINSLHRDVNEKSQQIVVLNRDLEAKKKEILRLATAVRLLKVDTRVAQVDVLEQTGSAEEGDLITRFSFVEVDEEGKRLDSPRTFSIEGDMVHVAALVVKFDDEFVELGDSLRSTSICLFQRIYGDAQKPMDGFALDSIGSQPAAYASGSQPSELEEEIWAEFWNYANDATKARKAGVRAAHGEAVFQKVVPGKRYKVFLRSSGGLTVIPEDLPEKPVDDPPLF